MWECAEIFLVLFSENNSPNSGSLDIYIMWLFNLISWLKNAPDCVEVDVFTLNYIRGCVFCSDLVASACRYSANLHRHVCVLHSHVKKKKWQQHCVLSSQHVCGERAWQGAGHDARTGPNRVYSRLTCRVVRWGKSSVCVNSSCVRARLNWKKRSPVPVTPPAASTFSWAHLSNASPKKQIPPNQPRGN